MERTLLSEALRELFNEETGTSLSMLSENADLANDLGLDSVDQFSFIMQVERHFRIRFANLELLHIVTFGDLVNLVSAKLRHQSATRAA